MSNFEKLFAEEQAEQGAPTKRSLVQQSLRDAEEQRGHVFHECRARRGKNARIFVSSNCPVWVYLQHEKLYRKLEGRDK